MNSACCFSSSLGGGVVRVATGVPISRKKFSCPAGEQIQSSRVGLVETLWNRCGALAGLFMVSPARTTDFLPTERRFDLAFQQNEGLLEIMAVWRRASAGRYVVWSRNAN